MISKSGRNDPFTGAKRPGTKRPGANGNRGETTRDLIPNV